MKLNEFSTNFYEYLKLHSNSTIAIGQENYMRNQFKFLGIKKPLLTELTKQFQEDYGSFSQFDLLHLSKSFTKYNEREMWYVAFDYLKKNKKKITIDFLPYLEDLITIGKWWDVIDVVAPHFIGFLATKESIMREKIENYRVHDNFWFRRTSIIFQLTYKNQTDADFLFHTCRILAHEQEFFIRKAIGWALREYSKTNPTSVKVFIENHSDILSYLSKKEGSKYLN